MSMIPGLGSNVLDKNNEKESIKRIKKFLCMMDSMNAKELDGESALAPARILRIAKGAGCHPEEINMLLNEYKRLKKLFTGLGKNMGGKGGNIGNISRN